jgi:hypothetical protein
LGLIIGCELDKCKVEVPVPTPVLEIIPGNIFFFQKFEHA